MRLRFKGTLKAVNWSSALGELLLIVIGVTIALAASSWYTNRTDRQKGTEYRGRLGSALASDVLQFADYEKLLQTKATTLKSLLTESVASLLANGPADLMRNLDYSECQALPESDAATFEELKSTGNLALIDDGKLRDTLAHYYSEFEGISAILAKSDGAYRRIMRESLPGSMTYAWHRTVRGQDPGDSGDPIDLDALRKGLEAMKSHVGFEAAINSELWYAADMLFWMRHFRTRAEELQGLLDSKK